MKILLIFTVCLMSDGGASNEVMGYSGGGVVIKCKYETRYKLNAKGFCKSSWPLCDNQIYTQTKKQWVTSGRFSLFDDTESAEFWVMIRKITVQDTGTYHCRVDLNLAIDSYTPLNLNIKNDQFNMTSITKTVGEDLTFGCNYPESLEGYKKFLCKWFLTPPCFYTDNKNYVTAGNFKVNYDESKRRLSASVSNVNQQDAGEYWCGAETEDDHKIFFTTINLKVTGPSTSSSSSSSSSSVLTPASSPAEFPVYTVITLPVILLLLLIGISILIGTLRKRCRMQASASKNSGTDNGVPLDVRVYEEIKDTKPLPASDAGTRTIYATAQLPTIPSDQGIYSEAQLPAHLSSEESDKEQINTKVAFSSNSTSCNNAE